MRYSPDAIDAIRTPLPACWGCHEAFTALQLTFYFPAGSPEVWMCLLHCVNGIAQDLDCGAPPGPQEAQNQGLRLVSQLRPASSRVSPLQTDK